MQSVIHFEKPVKSMLNAIRQSNYRILNVRYSKKYYCLLKKEMGKFPDSIANGLKRLGNGKCILAVFKPIGGQKKSILKLFIGALKLNYAESGTFRRQYERRTFTGSRAIISLNIRMRRNCGKINGNATKKSNHTFFETFKKRFYFVKKVINASQSLNLPFRLNGNSAKLLENVLARKLFGRYGMEKLGFLDSFAGAKLNFVLGHFPKPFEKFDTSFIANHILAINAFKRFRNVIKAYRYIGINGIVLICLTTKITATKHRTLRIIVFKKGQANKVIFIILLEIKNPLQRKRVADTHIKQGKGNVRFGGKSIKIKGAAAALVARFTLFFGGGFFAAAVKARRGVIGNTLVKSLKGCKRKRVR
ncbi:hypothetical protein GGTG_01683 [Gaeumannomyces tritici R3-111a-1]|uniref:Uncharacterized protein n=1 Tax=Gaeumannomyces tritici (strain R3-111a-1) TaxID=644352 RepID=J3NKA3_GAET3|nr:hypothetical protein GGTG_01683 [Gaeumannomyces tritici R3-111a-1]EJT81707.1 hypothetical protein GGTG_01683 [Gaeumannomyces tritici R3-111a-1]